MTIEITINVFAVETAPVTDAAPPTSPATLPTDESPPADVPDEVPVIKSSLNTTFDTDIDDYQSTEEKDNVEVVKPDEDLRKSIKRKRPNNKYKKHARPKCLACRDTGTAYWSEGVYGTCMQCNAGYDVDKEVKVHYSDD